MDHKSSRPIRETRRSNRQERPKWGQRCCLQPLQWRAEEAARKTALRRPENVVGPTPESAVPSPALLGDPSPVLDLWIGGPPRTGISSGSLFQNKTNPTPILPAKGRRAARRRN